MLDRSPSLDQTFAALADPTRRALLDRLRDGGRTVGELADPFPISLAAVSKHLRVLERAGLVERTVRGRTHHLRLCATPLRDATHYTAGYRAFWEERLDALEAHLDARHGKPPARSRGSRRTRRSS